MALTTARRIPHSSAHCDKQKAAGLHIFCSERGWQRGAAPGLVGTLLAFLALGAPAGVALAMSPRDWRREALGVPSDASLDDCKRAFRQQALRVHPDTAGQASSGDARFIQLSEAYRSLLEDPRMVGQQKPAWQDVPRHRGGFARAMRSRTTTLWLCGASLLGGVGIFAGALASHQLLFGKSNYGGPSVSSRSAVVAAVARRRKEQALQRGADGTSSTS